MMAYIAPLFSWAPDGATMPIFPLSLALSLLCSAIFLLLVLYRRQDAFLRSWLAAWLGLSLIAGLYELHWGLYAPFRQALNTTLLFVTLSFLFLSARQLERAPSRAAAPPAHSIGPASAWPLYWFWLGGALWAAVVLSGRIQHT